MGEWQELISDSKSSWEQNAENWDDYMGAESNRFHRELIRPYTEKLLNIKKGQNILDIACGNGNFSRKLAEKGANVVAFDYSSKMIERAKNRSKDYHNQIKYKVLDATNYDDLLELENEEFDGAVANMALMDIADIAPLINSLHKILKPNGNFVFSITHPCFQTPGVIKVNESKEDIKGNMVFKNSIQISNYLTPKPYKTTAIQGQTIPHHMFHRALSYYMNLAFESGFVLDGVEEPSFKKEKDENQFDWFEIPPVIIFRFKKM